MNASPDTLPVPETAAEAIAQCREQGLAEPNDVAQRSWLYLFAEHSKPTPGPWLKDEDNGIYRLLDGDRDYIFSTAGQDEDRANALLAVEASNVHDDTGLTPRELQKQRDELLAALKPLAGVLITHDGHIIGLMREDIRKARAAIASVEAQ